MSCLFYMSALIADNFVIYVDNYLNMNELKSIAPI
jgi:hypothetical protein